jgi:hypothetical protein
MHQNNYRKTYAKMRKIFTFLVGLLIPGYLIYNRLRFRNYLVDINEFAFIYIFFFALNLGLFCLFLAKALTPWIKKWLTRAGDKNTGQWLDKSWVQIVLKIIGYPKMAMKEVYGKIFDHFDQAVKQLLKFSRNLLQFTEKQLTGYFAIVCILCELLPRIIILAFFISDVFFIGTLHYFYMSLSLLIIPFLFNFFVFMIEDIGPRLLAEFNTYVTFTEFTGKDGGVFKSVKYKDEHKDENNNPAGLLNFMTFSYEPMETLLPHITPSLELRKKLKTYFLLIYHLAMVIGWGYVLFLNYVNTLI